MISVKESKVIFSLGGSSPFATDLSDEFPGVDFFEVEAHMSSPRDQRGVNVDVTQNIVFMVVIKLAGLQMDGVWNQFPNSFVFLASLSVNTCDPVQCLWK